MIIYPELSHLLELYDEVVRQTGGGYGLRDIGALESALLQPQQTFGQQDLYPLLHEKVAVLGYALIMNHPFVDGNKRMGLVAMEFFLRLNSSTLSADEESVVNTILAVASGQIGKFELTQWVQQYTKSL